MPMKKAPIDSFNVIQSARMIGKGKPTFAMSGARPMDASGFPAWNAVTYQPIYSIPNVNASRKPAARESKKPMLIIAATSSERVRVKVGRMNEELGSNWASDL